MYGQADGPLVVKVVRHLERRTVGAVVVPECRRGEVRRYVGTRGDIALDDRDGLGRHQASRRGQTKEKSGEHLSRIRRTRRRESGCTG